MSGAREWYEWSTAVHERCTRLRSGARDCGVVHEHEWCTSKSGARDSCTSTSGAQDWCTRVRSGARVVHEIGGARDGCTRIEVHEMGARV